MIFPLERLADIVWPRMCQICGREVDRPARHICSDCLMRLPFLPADGLCRKCGRDAPGLDGEFLCDECRAFRPSFDRAVSSFRMEGDARELVNAFKFRDAIYLRDDLVDFLEASVRVRFVVDGISCVVPIPSTLSSRFLRGYSQQGACAAAWQAFREASAARRGAPEPEGAFRGGSPQERRGHFHHRRTSRRSGAAACHRRCHDHGLDSFRGGEDAQVGWRGKSLLCVCCEGRALSGPSGADWRRREARFHAFHGDAMAVCICNRLVAVEEYKPPRLEAERLDSGSFHRL